MSKIPRRGSIGFGPSKASMRKWRIAWALIYLLCSGSAAPTASPNGDGAFPPKTEAQRRKEYVLNPEHLGVVYHRATSQALLHGKAKKELASLPAAEHILYNDCAKSVKNVLQLSRCVAGVLMARDRMAAARAEGTAQSQPEPECTEDSIDGNWLVAAMRRWWWQVWRRCDDHRGEKAVKPNENADRRAEDSKKSPVTQKNDVMMPKLLKLRNVEIRRSPQRFHQKAANLSLSVGTQPFDHHLGNGSRITSQMRNAIRRLEIPKNGDRIAANPQTADSSQILEIQTPKSTTAPDIQSPNSNTLLPNLKTKIQKLTKPKPKTPKLPIRPLNPKPRAKRRVSDVSPRCETPTNVASLRALQSQFDKLNHVVKFLYNTTKSNQKFLEEMDVKVDYKNRPPTRDSPLEKAREFATQLEEFDDHDIVRVLSPQLLQLMPSSSMRDPGSKQWLSPDMLGFHEDGMLPLPRLLRLSTSSHCETMRWVDFLMDFTGAARLMREVDKIFGGFMADVEKRMYPAVQETRRHEQRFEQIHGISDEEQRRHLADHGYALMNAEQLAMVYGKGGLMESPGDEAEFHADQPLEELLEAEILAMSRMSEAEFLDAHRHSQPEPKRSRRAAATTTTTTTTTPAPPPGSFAAFLNAILPMTTQKQVFGLRVLNPFAFTTRIRNANIMGPYFISPYAFYLQVISPTILHMDVISPRAFIATTFSPVLMTARILAPSAFRLMLFSPLVMILWVMVPEAFLAKIFSPKVMDARILAPESFSFILLSPAAGVLRAASPNTMNFLVLSPAFGTYQLMSGNRYVIQVLSPGILGIDSHPMLREPIDPAG